MYKIDWSGGGSRTRSLGLTLKISYFYCVNVKICHKNLQLTGKTDVKGNKKIELIFHIFLFNVLLGVYYSAYCTLL